MSKANLKNYRWETVDDVDFFTIKLERMLSNSIAEMNLLK